MKFLLILPKGVNFIQPKKGQGFDGFTDLHHKSVSQTLILNQKQLDMHKILNLRQQKI